jgi:hypothetical protein
MTDWPPWDEGGHRPAAAAGVMDAVPMHPLTPEERNLIPNGQEAGVPWTEPLPEVPEAERGRVEGVVPLPYVAEAIP